MTPKLIKTNDDYENALERIEEIFDAQPDSPEFDELELLVKLTELYEEEHFPIEKPDPISAIKFRMEQQGLKNQDLVPFIGSKSKVSEVLSGKKNLSLNMIRNLSKGLDIPLEILIQEPVSKPVNYSILDYCTNFPFTEMVKRGWFNFDGTLAEAKEKKDELLLDFIGPLKIQNFDYAYNRKSDLHEVENINAILMAWRIRVLNLALKEKVDSWDINILSDKFFSDLANLSYLTKGPLLAKEYLNKAGIHLIIEEHLKSSHLDGCSMLMPDGHPLIALTLRYDRIDCFWFTLFHELAHVKFDLSENHFAFFDDTSNVKNQAIEQRADNFANNMLITKSEWDNSNLTINSSPLEILAFAKKLRISPAIPAGRLRFENNNYTVFTKLIGNGQVKKLFV